MGIYLYTEGPNVRWRDSEGGGVPPLRRARAAKLSHCGPSGAFVPNGERGRDDGPRRELGIYLHSHAA